MEYLTKSLQIVRKIDLKRKLKHLPRRVLRTSLKLVFVVRYRKRHARLSLEQANGVVLVVPPKVFNPALFGSSLFLATFLEQHALPPGSTALDLGCGSGLLGIGLARAGLLVTATDINPEAVWTSRVNAHLNGYDQLYTAWEGSLYEPVEGQSFDLIVMNPPYYAGQPTTPLEQAFLAGPGLETLIKMLSGAANHLTPTGRALAVVSSTIPLSAVLEEVERVGLKWRIVARKRYWAEWHLIYELRLAGNS